MPCFPWSYKKISFFFFLRKTQVCLPIILSSQDNVPQKNEDYFQQSQERFSPGHWHTSAAAGCFLDPLLCHKEESCLKGSDLGKFIIFTAPSRTSLNEPSFLFFFFSEYMGWRIERLIKIIGPLPWFVPRCEQFTYHCLDLITTNANMDKRANSILILL